MAEIDLTPTEEMAANAARGLELRRKHGKGGTEIGVARARDISNRKNLSPETVRRMHAFFSRHEKNKAGGEDDAGYIAWLLWGGDSGQSWAKRKVEQMNKGENERSDTYKEIAQRLGSVAKMSKVDRARVLKELRALRDNARAERNKEAERLASMYLAGLNRANTTEDDWEEADMASSKILDVLHGEYARPGAKAKFGMTNAGYKALVDAIRVYGDSAPAAVVAQAKQMKQEPTEFTDNEVMAVIAKMKQSRASRPGAKARMSKDWQTIERYLEVLDTEFGEPRGKAAAQEMMRAAAAIGGDEGARLKAAINTMATSRDYNARQRAYNAIASMMPFSRPGAKAKMAAHWTERVEVVEDVSFRNKNTGATVSGGGAVPWRSSADRANWEAITHYSLMDTRTGTTAGKQYRTRQEAERALADAKAQRIRDERRAEREASSPDARRRAATIKEIDRLMATGMTQIEAIQYLKSRGLRIASSRPGAKVANAVREGEKVSASDDAVSRKIRKLMDEGKPQKQAVAIALDLERRGEL